MYASAHDHISHMCPDVDDPGRAILSKDLSYVIIIVCGVQVAAALSLGASRNSAGQVGQAGLPSGSEVTS